VWSRGVLLAVDPAQTAALRAPLVDAAVAVAAECGLPLSVASVAPSADDPAHGSAQLAVQAAVQAAQARQVSAHGEVRLGHRPFEQIVSAADARDADLIVVGRHGEALHGHVFLGGTTQKVIGLAERPVLVVIPRHPPTGAPE
jgi:nucleotide-binding universal stress UspA family protein